MVFQRLSESSSESSTDHAKTQRGQRRKEERFNIFHVLLCVFAPFASLREPSVYAISTSFPRSRRERSAASTICINLKPACPSVSGCVPLFMQSIKCSASVSKA